MQYILISHKPFLPNVELEVLGRESIVDKRPSTEVTIGAFEELSHQAEPRRSAYKYNKKFK